MWFLEHTRGKRACARCGGAISKRSTYCVYPRSVYDEFAESETSFHPSCGLDVYPDATISALLDPDSTLAFEGYDQLRTRALALRAIIAYRRGEQWRFENGPACRYLRPPVHSDGGAPAHDLRVADNQGRPRVRVLVAGRARHGDSASGRQLRGLLPALSWASPKREYAFVTALNRNSVADEDPLQPVIGGIYMAIATKNATIADCVDVLRWNTLGIRPPVLWLIGLSSHTPRDEHTVRFRELMDKLGYRGDECAVLRSPRIDPGALDALVRTMDEVFDGDEQRLPANIPLATAKRLQADIQDRQEHRYNGDLVSIRDRVDLLHSIQDMSITPIIDDCVSLLLDRKQVLLAQAFLPVPMSRATYDRWFREWWVSREDLLPLNHATLHYSCFIEESGIARALGLVADRIDSVRPSKFAAFLDVIEQGWCTIKELPEVEELVATRIGNAKIAAKIQKAIARRRGSSPLVR